MFRTSTNRERGRETEGGVSERENFNNFAILTCHIIIHTPTCIDTHTQTDTQSPYLSLSRARAHVSVSV